MEERRQVTLVPSSDPDKTPDTATLMVTECPPLGLTRGNAHPAEHT